MDCFSPGKWLNNFVINYYMGLIIDRSNLRPDLPKVLALDTFFYSYLTEKSLSWCAGYVNRRALGNNVSSF